jgi:hypothetical protein
MVRVPEEIAEGDDITVVISATATEQDIERIVALQYPDSWKPKRAWRVEAGATTHVALIPDPEIQSAFSAEPGNSVLALADYIVPPDPESEGTAYFIVFRTKAATNPTQQLAIKAALVERMNPDAKPQIDPKTKKPKPFPMSASWHMVFPAKSDFSFTGFNMKHLIAGVRMERVLKASRAFVAEGRGDATAVLRTSPEAVQDYFRHPFTLMFWLRSTEPEQTLLAFHGGDGSEAAIGAGLLGQPMIMLHKPQQRGVLAGRGLLNDGMWHHLAISKDSLGKLRIFFDGQPASVTDAPKGFLQNVASISLGDAANENDLAIDELRMLRGAVRDPADFDKTIAASARDTVRNAFAVFHFDDYGNIARSSVPMFVSQNAKESVPAYFVIDSGATITETTSPVQFDPVMLSADLTSSTQVSIRWRTTSELGIKQFRLERRVGSFGPFEKVFAVDAKHGMKAPKRGQSIVARSSYQVNEDLPKLNGDIELYYRLATVGFSEKDPVIYSMPVKIEYGTDRDVFVEQNEPNPFNPTTQIAFRLAKAAQVKLSVFDMIGREVAVIVNNKLDPGRHTYTLDAGNWPGGIYFYKVKTPKTTITRKMVLAK